MSKYQIIFLSVIIGIIIVLMPINNTDYVTLTLDEMGQNGEIDDLSLQTIKKSMFSNFYEDFQKPDIVNTEFIQIALVDINSCDNYNNPKDLENLEECNFFIQNESIQEGFNIFRLDPEIEKNVEYRLVVRYLSKWETQLDAEEISIND